jgi:hypothetical protein
MDYRLLLLLSRRHGRSHRLLGGLELAWLVLGFLRLSWPTAGDQMAVWHLAYDIMLGVLGTCLTYSAAASFGKSRVKNVASGALDLDTTITLSEMQEHGFYQILNLCQILFLHSLSWHPPFVWRLLGAVLTTLPWLVRSRFPVNSFSANYTEQSAPRAWSLIGVLYRLKKYQYLLYKHVLLHGLDATVALTGGTEGPALVHSPGFRLYWLFLNTAYVMEFFLQTLVKRGYMSQALMLLLNKLLMVVSTLSALSVLGHTNVLLAAVSLSLNILHRGHELTNFALVLTFGMTLLYADVFNLFMLPIPS